MQLILFRSNSIVSIKGDGSKRKTSVVKDHFWELFEAEYTYLFLKLFLFTKQILWVNRQTCKKVRKAAD